MSRKQHYFVPRLESWRETPHMNQRIEMNLKKYWRLKNLLSKLPKRFFYSSIFHWDNIL